MFSDLELKANVLLQSGIFQDNACYITLLKNIGALLCSSK